MTSLDDRIEQLQGWLCERVAVVVRLEQAGELVPTELQRAIDRLSADHDWLRELRARRIAMGRDPDDERTAAAGDCGGDMSTVGQKSMIAKSRHLGQWIEATGWQPDEGVSVLAIGVSKHGHRSYRIAQYSTINPLRKHRNKPWPHWYCPRYRTVMNVTHWMPLPEMPADTVSRPGFCHSCDSMQQGVVDGDCPGCRAKQQEAS